jgi:hypothetical protein
VVAAEVRVECRSESRQEGADGADAGMAGLRSRQSLKGRPRLQAGAARTKRRGIRAYRHWGGPTQRLIAYCDGQEEPAVGGLACRIEAAHGVAGAQRERQGRGKGPKTRESKEGTTGHAARGMRCEKAK